MNSSDGLEGDISIPGMSGQSDSDDQEFNTLDEPVKDTIVCQLESDLLATFDFRSFFAFCTVYIIVILDTENTSDFGVCLQLFVFANSHLFWRLQFEPCDIKIVSTGDEPWTTFRR